MTDQVDGWLKNNTNIDYIFYIYSLLEIQVTIYVTIN